MFASGCALMGASCLTGWNLVRGLEASVPVFEVEVEDEEGDDEGGCAEGDEIEFGLAAKHQC